MNTKKLVALTILFGIFSTFVLPMEAFAIKNTKKHEETKADYINLAWWQEYNDEYLSGYIVKALENNNDLKIAAQKVEQARQASNIQLGDELPTLSVGASPILAKIPRETKSTGFFSVPFIATYELDLFLKNRDKTRSLKKAYEAKQYQEKAVYIAVAGAVGTAYYNIVKLDKLIEIQDKIIKDRKTIYDLMKKRNEAGITSTADLTRAEKAYVLSTTDLIELKKAREIMLNTLCVLIGESPNNSNEIKRISYDELSGEKQIPQTISSEVIVSRPDYLAAQKMVEKAKMDVRVAKKEFLPTIDIGGLITFTAASIAGLGSMGWETALAGVGANGLLPIFTGGKRIANLKLQKSVYEEILQNYYKTNLTSIQEVNDSLSTLKLDNEKYQKNVQIYDMEKKDFRYSELQYEEGVMSYLDLTQRKETLLDIEKLVVSSKIDNYVDQIGLYKATAGAELL